MESGSGSMVGNFPNFIGHGSIRGMKEGRWGEISIIFDNQGDHDRNHVALIKEPEKEMVVME